MTPAVIQLTKSAVSFQIHEYGHNSSAKSYGEEAAEKLKQPAARVFKTLVVEDSNGNLGVGVIPVNCELDLKAIAGCLGAKKAKMADPEKVERSTGYVLGGVSPIGQKRRLKTFIDDSALDMPSLFVSGGKRGMDIELAPMDLARLTNARYESLGINK